MRVNVYLRSRITQKKERRYYLVVRRYGFKDETINIGPVSARLAEQKRAIVLNELLTGTYQSNSLVAPVIDDFCNKVINDFAIGARGHETVRIYQGNIAKLLAQLSGRPLNEITKEQLENLLCNLKAKKATGVQSATGRTKNIMLSTLNLIFGKAVEWGYLNLSPAQGIRRFKENSKGKRALTDHELQLLLDHATPLQRAYLQVAVLTGLRANALRNLRFRDVSWETRQIKAIKKGGGCYYVSMNTELGEILGHLRHYWPNPKFGSNKKRDMPMYLPRTKEQQEYVFCHANGQPFKKGFRCLERLYDRLGIQGVGIHGLRKTFCTLLAKNKVHPKVAQQLMGHSDVKLTMDIYTDVQTEQLHEAVNLLPSLGTVQRPTLRLVTG